MANTKQIEERARNLCTHTIVYTDRISRMAVVRAMQGLTTKAIAEELGISVHEAAYRIQKAQKSQATQFRRDYRSGNGKLSKRMLQATEAVAMQEVDNTIAPLFIPLARTS